MKKKDLFGLIGKIAIADTNLQPKGTVSIEDEIYEAESQDSYIDAGRGVRVVGVRGKKVVVKLV